MLPRELPNDPHGIFAAGGALVPTQGKKKIPKDPRKLGKNRKISKLHRIITYCPALPPKPNIPPIPVENRRKIEIKVFPYCAILHKN